MKKFGSNIGKFLKTVLKLLKNCGHFGIVVHNAHPPPVLHHKTGANALFFQR